MELLTKQLQNLKELGAKFSIGVKPNGLNINEKMWINLSFQNTKSCKKI